MLNRKSTIAPPTLEDIQTAQESGFAPDHPNKDEYITEVRTYKLITPLFGGGVEAGVNDPVTLTRGSSIRGHLRFWWRATRGGQFDGKLDKMKAAEDVIWGSASTSDDKGGPSKVQIVVHNIKVDNQEPTQEYIDARADAPYEVVPKRDKPNEYVSKERRGSRVPGYGGFPLQPDAQASQHIGETRDNKLIKKVLFDVSFDLSITFSRKHIQDVYASLWAWQTFGGIGARTRRGFGALFSNNDFDKQLYLDAPSYPKCFNEVENWIKYYLDKYVVEGKWYAHVPHLSKALKDTHYRILIKRNPPNSLDMWKHLLFTLKNFRQQRPIEKFTKHNRIIEKPKRNRWNEPDAIRRITNICIARHSTPINGMMFNKFPRAAFGLPIIFHFPQAGEPYDTSLQIDGYERFSSPLLLRPFQITDHQSVGIAVILVNSYIPNQLVLLSTKSKKKQQNPTNKTVHFEHQLTVSEAQQIMRSDDKTQLLGTKTDVLQAFLSFLEQETK